MTTFQYIIDSMINALYQVVPFAEGAGAVFEKTLLGWPGANIELMLMVSLIGSLCFLIFFRYDWLGLFSAVIRTLVRPTSLNSGARTLDQHSVLFLLIVATPAVLVERIFSRELYHVISTEHLQSFWMIALGCFITAFLLHASPLWNRRLKGLNHLKLSDAWIIGAFTLLSLHPSIPLVAVLWAAFAFTSYHYESVFKYTMLTIGLSLFVRTIGLMSDLSVQQAIKNIGYLNSVPVIVISFSAFWIALENLQKTLSESTYRSFKWLNLFTGLILVILYFTKG